MSSKSIGLDTNILIRAVLGKRVRNLILRYNETVDFFVPDICLADVYKYLPQIFEKHKMPSEPVIAVTNWLSGLHSKFILIKFI